MLQNRTCREATRISIAFARLWGISGLLLVLLCALGGGDASAQRRERKQEPVQPVTAAAPKPMVVCTVSVRNIVEQPLAARIRLVPTDGGDALSGVPDETGGIGGDGGDGGDGGFGANDGEGGDGGTGSTSDGADGTDGGA